MTVYVDEVMRWSHARPPFKHGSCHLTADTLDELHAFAVGKLKLKREWFQDGRVPHYDLTPGKRCVAVRLGAVFVPAREQARRRIEARQGER